MKERSIFVIAVVVVVFIAFYAVIVVVMIRIVVVIMIGRTERLIFDDHVLIFILFHRAAAAIARNECRRIIAVLQRRLFVRDAQVERLIAVGLVQHAQLTGPAGRG